jgi:D-alanyl-D-alanine carboxypeptidase/D-alanyl-D-alanine-endopeptidase (penicillin-binding protein 4)
LSALPLVKIFLVSCLLFGFASVLRAQDTRGTRTLDQLREQIAAHLAEPGFSAALWGVKVVSLNSGKTLFEDHPGRLMSPASNSKLYVAALGLDRLGGDYRFATPIYAAGRIDAAGKLHGNLLVVGQGDPSWNERQRGTNFWSLFDPYVAILAHAGVRRVTGDLVADATFFHGPPTGSGWTADDLRDGNAGFISALSLDDNLVRVRVEPGARVGAPCLYHVLPPGSGLVFQVQALTAAPDAAAHLDCYPPPASDAVYLAGQLPLQGVGKDLDVAVPQPAIWFANALKEALARQGISVGGRVRALAWPQTGVALAGDAKPVVEKLGAAYSPPLREIVRDFLKTSQNLETDLLLAHLGELARSSNAPPAQTSEEAGLAELQRFLAKAGVPAADVQFDEGSGLSRNNLATAEATVQLLQFMARHPEADAFLAALPVAGVDGTLAHRFAGTAAAGNVRAKTGTLRWAQSLSGYLTTAAGERLAFAIMLNRFVAAPGRTGAEEIDPLVVALANFAGRSTDSP